MTSWSYVWGTTRAAKRETRASRRPSQFLWRPCRGGSSANRERKIQQTLPNRVFQQRVRGSGTEMWGRLASRRADHGLCGSYASKRDRTITSGLPTIHESDVIWHCERYGDVTPTTRAVPEPRGIRKREVRSPSDSARGLSICASSRNYAAIAILRSDLKPARTSSERSCGCSHAAKCPPLSSLL